jgi:hypothetical protein
MKGKIQLEIYESDVLKSIATSQSKEDTFEFVSKILNNYEHPTETAFELINHLESYIDEYQRSVHEEELFQYVDEKGNLTGKYKSKSKKRQENKKQKFIDNDKPSCYC